MKKWKFFFNGCSWWLKITDKEQLDRYCEIMFPKRFGGEIFKTADYYRHPEKFSHAEVTIPCLILNVAKSNETSILGATGKIMSECEKTLYSVFERFGFVNINKLGGCNGCSGLPDWEEKEVVFQDDLRFPSFNFRDIEVKTYKLDEMRDGVFRDNHNYHYYAFVGGVQVKEGETTKWNTYSEAYNAAKRWVKKFETLSET